MKKLVFVGLVLWLLLGMVFVYGVKKVDEIGLDNIVKDLREAD